MKNLLRPLSRTLPVVTLLCGLLTSAAAAQPPDGQALFERDCAACHLTELAPRAPSLDAMRALPPAAIVASLTDGVMQQQGLDLSADDREAIAAFVTGDTAVGDASMAAGTGQCATGAAWPGPGNEPQWNGWGVDASNRRFQSTAHAGLTAEDVPGLRLRWAFGYPDAGVAQSQPTVVGGRLFVGSQRGVVYALDAATGCTHWSFEAGSGVRSAMVVTTLTDGQHAVVFGDLSATVFALDAATGAELWRRTLDEHPAARITGGSVLHDGRLYVPVSSLEEGFALNAAYPCCSFRGSLAALDVATGEVLWHTYVIPEPTDDTDETTRGPAGAAIWSAPTIDEARGVVYAATGNAYTEPAADTSDAIMAFDLETGDIRWVRQFTAGDAFVLCRGDNPNCPEEQGPDFDFGASPVLVTMTNGLDLLVVGQKSGVGYGLDPDREGAIVWQYRVGDGGLLGGIEWGFAVDDDKAYFANSDYISQEGQPGALAAIRLRTGELVWFAEPHEPICESCSPARLAAVTVIPGVVFSGSMDGLFRAFSSETGAVLWDVDTNGSHETVNGVEASGGSINGPGAVVVDGMVYVNSGYGTFGGRAGNVLLAFGVED